jgi:hypothetical protein
MPGKKAHKPRDPGNVGNHKVHGGPGRARKSTGETEGQFARTTNGGQFTGAGEPPLMKK